ncbi:MAG: ice-binding family protein, partial [Aquihabitans sp.]
MLSTLGILTLMLTVEKASAATPPVGLGTATGYAVLAGSTITNTGNSVVNGDLGLSPGTAVTGFPPGVLNGVEHTADAEALQAKSDLSVAYDDAAGRTPATSVAAELGGNTFAPGVYVGNTLGLTGTVTLDAGGDPDAVFVFQTNTTLITASNSSVVLLGDANVCNIYWQVGSSATLGTDTNFVGTIMASESISANTGAVVEGRLLALNGAVTLDDNVIDRPMCETLPPGSTTTSEVGATTTSEVGATTTSEVGATTTSEVGATTTSEVG